MNRGNRLPIRPGMDVYDRYQSVFIGSVVKVLQAASDERTNPMSAQPEGNQSPAESTLKHKQGAETTPERASSSTLGEELGPFPTAGAGNSGPERQSAGRAYATGPAHPREGIETLLVRPGRINLGILTSPLHVPISAIEAITLERVILNVSGDRMPSSWRDGPAGT